MVLLDSGDSNFQFCIYTNHCRSDVLDKFNLVLYTSAVTYLTSSIWCCILRAPRKTEFPKPLFIRGLSTNAQTDMSFDTVSVLFQECLIASVD